MLRGQQRAGELAPERVAELEALPGRCWEAQRRPAIERRLASLEAYAAAHPGIVHRQGEPIGAAVTLIEPARDAGLSTPDEQARFAAIPLVSRTDGALARLIADLRAFQAANRSGAEPTSDSPPWYGLDRARRAWRRGSLTPAQAAALAELGYAAWKPAKAA